MSWSDQQIERIAIHALEDPSKLRRFNSAKFGPPMNISDKDDLVTAIKLAAHNLNTEYVVRAEGGYLIHHADTNLTIQADGLGGGTAFRETPGKAFPRVIRQENDLRETRGLPPAEKVIGPVPLERDVNRTQHLAKARKAIEKKYGLRRNVKEAVKDEHSR